MPHTGTNTSGRSPNPASWEVSCAMARALSISPALMDWRRQERSHDASSRVPTRLPSSEYANCGAQV
ncbi:hypothetical protein SMICM17S_11496 [Streptomyces microflavus]